jgi:hypothetical protein
MKRHSNILTLVLCVALFGCGSGSYSNGGGSPSSPTMQAGQWEFVVTPSSGAPPAYIETNLTLATNQVSSDPLNTVLFKFGGTVGGQFSFCNNWALSAVVANGVFGGNGGGSLYSPGQGGPEAIFSGGTIASNGQSVSGGSYTDNGSFCDLESAKTSGTLTGYTVAPLNGTFSGTLTGSTQPQQVTLQITQDSHFGITASGTSVLPGVTTNLAISPGGTGLNNVIGATVQAVGTATNVNGSSAFIVIGHFNPTGTQITVSEEQTSGFVEGTGTLTKQ